MDGKGSLGRERMGWAAREEDGLSCRGGGWAVKGEVRQGR